MSRPEPSGLGDERTLELLKSQYFRRLLTLQDRLAETRRSLPAYDRDRAGLLSLVEHYLEGLETGAEAAFERPRPPVVRAELNRLQVVIELVEVFFLEPRFRRPPAWLRSIVWEEARRAGILATPVLVEGDADNFSAVLSIRELLFRRRCGPQLFPSTGGPTSERVTSSSEADDYLLVRLSWIDGYRSLMTPLVAGHELSHFVIDHAVDLDHLAGELISSFEKYTAAPSWDDMDGTSFIKSWLAEFLCDIRMLARFGPGSISSLAEFLELSGRSEASETTTGHPPGRLRLSILLAVLESEYPELARHPAISQVLAIVRYRLGQNDGHQVRSPFERFIADTVESVGRLLVEGLADELKGDWFHEHPEQLPDGAETARIRFLRALESVNDSLVAGRPVTHVDDGRSRRAPTPAELIGGAWCAATVNPASVEAVTELLDASMVFRSLGQHLRTEMPSFSGVVVRSNTGTGSEPGPETSARWVSVVPAGRFDGSTVELRLGHRFVLFGPASPTAATTPIQGRTDNDRDYSIETEHDWGEPLRVDSGAYVEARTFEYVSLAPTLLGSLAVLPVRARQGLEVVALGPVKPGRHAPLVFGLRNLSNGPMFLYPGEPVCQLAVHPVMLHSDLASPYVSGRLNDGGSSRLRTAPSYRNPIEKDE